MSIIIPSIASSTTLAISSMEDMGHATVDAIRCTSQHQISVAPAGVRLDKIDRDKDEPISPEQPYFTAFQHQFREPIKPKLELILLSSFRPPDIVILTAHLRI